MNKSRSDGGKVNKHLELEISGTSGRNFFPYLRKHLIRAHRLLSPCLQSLSIAAVGDTRMSALHEQFLGIPGPTDVLTFELEHDSRGRVTSGEVVICGPEARRQAQQRETDVREELLLYALHGMLHLCGFDDRTESGYRRMHRKEDEILTQLGVGAVFAKATPRRRSAGGSKEH